MIRSGECHSHCLPGFQEGICQSRTGSFWTRRRDLWVQWEEIQIGNKPQGSGWIMPKGQWLIERCKSGGRPLLGWSKALFLAMIYSKFLSMTWMRFVDYAKLEGKANILYDKISIQKVYFRLEQRGACKGINYNRYKCKEHELFLNFLRQPLKIPLNLLFFRLNSSSSLKRSSYGTVLRLVTILLTLLWTFSSL